jgi:hypothetical protein
VAEHLTSEHKALSSIPSTGKKLKKRKSERIPLKLFPNCPEFLGTIKSSLNRKYHPG